jgi:hypothetical protein
MTRGNLAKMRSAHTAPIEYSLPLSDALIPLKPYIGSDFQLVYTGNIYCVNCGRKTPKSFDEGYCWPCSQKLAACDMCIVKPELCHFAAGTCREPDWGLKHCFQPHYVYLANSSGLKVGITREVNLPYRWIDQGAVQALTILKVQSRLQSGLVETMFKAHVADKTDWRKMLKNESVEIDLKAWRDQLISRCEAELSALRSRFGDDAISLLPDAEPVTLEYHVLQYPTKITSLNLDKDPIIRGRLLGIKGQYLILDTGVINIRKFSGYEVELEG